MTKKKSSQKLSVNVEGNVKDSNIIVGNGNIVTVIRNYIFRDTRQFILFVVIFLLMSIGITGAFWYSKQPQEMMGDFNIAIAQFGEIKEDGSVEPSANAEKISSVLFNFLDSEYQASGLGRTVQVAHKNMPLIGEEADAEELARKINANIVIFGNISVQGDHAEFSPRFYVAEQLETKEMTGTSELAHPIPFSVSDLRFDNEIHTELRARTEILFNFTKGLIFYSEEDLDSAARSIQAAIATAEKLPRPFEGEEVLYLLATKIKISQDDMEGANQMLDQALALNPNYARAHLARGSIFYVQATKPNYDSDLLDKALSEFTLAYEAPNQPEGAYISIKAHASLGNVLVLRAQQTNDPDLFSQAIYHYLYVTESYERTKDRSLRSYAAVAYFGLGAAYERQGQKNKAVDYYEQAYNLTDDGEFKTKIEKQIKVVRGN